MSREAGDFADISGDIAFLNGIYTAYVEEILYPVLKTGNMISLLVDIFSTFDKEETRADQALSAQIKNYLEVGNFDKDGTFIPLPSNDNFEFPLEEKMNPARRNSPDDGILEKELYHFMEAYSDPTNLPAAVKAFIQRTHWYLSGFTGLYHADSELIGQLKKSIHFQRIPSDAIFLVFGSEVMMLTIGYDY